MTTDTVAVDDAAGMLAEAEQTLARWTDEAAAKTRAAEAAAAQQAEAEARSGVDALDDPGAVGDIADQLIRLRTEQDVAHRAARAAAERLEESRRDLLRTRAGVVRDRAARLREVAAERQKRTDELLDALERHEGPRYVAPASGLTLTGGSKLPLTTVVLRGATSLETWATETEQRADTDTPDQLMYHLGRPMPEPLPAEHQFTAVVAAVG